MMKKILLVLTLLVTGFEFWAGNRKLRNANWKF